MVEVLKEPMTAQQSANPTGLIQSIMHNLPIIIFVAIVIALCVAIYVMWQKMNDQQKKRDHPVYEKYCNIKDACQLNANHKWIDHKYSFTNLFWFGIPLRWNEHSVKVRNKDDEVLGWYRGHYMAQDGYLNLLVYKTKKWLIIEDLFVIKCPIHISYRKKVVDKDGNIIFDNENQPKFERHKLNFSKYVKYLSNMDIKLMCFGLETYSYFTYPVYISETGEPIDLSGFLGENVVEMGQGVLLTQVFEEGSRMARKGMEHNPQVNADRMTPDKVKEDNK